MKFTEDFIELPIVVYITIDDFYDSSIKVLPRYILSYGMRKSKNGGEMLVVYVSGVGDLYITLTVEEFEKRLNDFVGEPVTYTEKHIALMAKMLEKLNEP